MRLLSRLRLEAERQARVRLFRQRKLRRRKPPRIAFPAGIDRSYRRILVGLVNELRELVEREVFPRLPSWEVEALAFRPDSDTRLDNWISDTGDVVAVLLAAMRRSVEDLETVVPMIAERTVDWALKQEAKAFAAFDLSLILRLPWLADQVESFRAENLSLIKSLTEETIRKIGDTIQRDFRTGRDHRKVARDLRDQLDIAANRAKLIARDQISKLNSQLHQLIQTEMGIDEFRWETALDDRVRPSHAEKEGRIYRWDTPPADTGLPGESVNCRCVGAPLVDKLIAETNRVLRSA